MLEQPEIAHYLLSLGLVKPSVIIEEDLTIADASRRNSVFIATTRTGPTYVVKQAGPGSARTVAHEAAILRMLADAAPLRDHVPVVAHHDAEVVRLVLRSPGDLRDWSEHQVAGRFPRGSARELGRTLAAVHRLPAGGAEDLPTGVDRMWGLSLAEPSRELLLDLSAGAQDLVARLQASRVVCERLRELRDCCTDDGFVHGDLRWDNCLAITGSRSRRVTRVVMIDWELSGRGPPAFDVGSVVAEYLRVWAGSIPIIEPSDPGRLVSQARHPLGRMTPAIAAFWSAYRLASARPPALRQVIELAAVRMLQTAVEGAQGIAFASAHLVMLLQLAENLLREPQDAARYLLGLRE